MKNKIAEDSMMATSTSNTTGTNSSSSNGKTTINLKKKDLSDPSVQKNLSTMKDAQVNVIDEIADEANTNQGLVYVSNVKDSNTGEISKPFSINGKTYQMVRAMTPTREKVLGVYSHDESKDGNDVIYDVQHFEDNIANPAKGEAEPEQAPVPDTQDAGHGLEEAPVASVSPEEKEDNKRFAGYKHFIVNRKTGKSRKFKKVSELAKASMNEDEEYMGIREFKKYIDEVLFGSRKAVMSEDTPIDPTIVQSSQKLMNLIQERIPKEAITHIQNNQQAQAQVIIDFARLIGVPTAQYQKIIQGIKTAQTNTNSTSSTSSSTSSVTASVNENRKVIKTLKIKDIK